MSNFLARQKLDDVASPRVLGLSTEPDEDEVDHSLAHLMFGGPQSQSAHKSMKGRIKTVEWDEELENMSREKAAADASRGENQLIPPVSHAADFTKLYETRVLIPGNLRSQNKVSYQRSEATDEQAFNPALTDSARRQGPTSIE